MTASAQHPSLATCENCHTALQGHYCHVCGQSAHDPTRHLGHAIEEVFESFWHLDGRIFRTLRDLPVPGRIARNYLDGKRVTYVQPLRLFVILTLFTFFVMKLTVHGSTTLNVVTRDDTFTTAATVAEVEARRDQALAELDESVRQAPAMAGAMVAPRRALELAADRRLAELRGEPLPTSEDTGLTLNFQSNGKRWDPQTNPVKWEGVPQFVNDFVNRRLVRMQENVQRMGNDAGAYFTAILTALPGALFLLMPVFALVLRVIYLRRPIGYLGHLVVALYSHAWLMVVILATTLVNAAGTALGFSDTGPLIISGLLWMTVPLYLLVMQQRVYGGRWWLTLLRYLFIGGVYFWLVGAAVIYAVFAGISA